MKQKLAFLFFLVSIPFFAQKDTLFIQTKPIVSTRVVLYSAEGATQKYITYSDAMDGKFKLVIDVKQAPGMYRLVFNQKTMDYIDFLYLGKGFSITFNPKNTDESIVFSNSPENEEYYNYLNSIGKLQQTTDSLQVAYFQETVSKKLNNIESQYKDLMHVIKKLVKNVTLQVNNPWVKDLVLANVRVQPEKPIKNPEEYLPFVKNHYFDTIDFNNNHLIHSPIIVDKVMDYVFYLTLARDESVQNKLYKEAVDKVMQRTSNQKLKQSLLKALIQSFAKEENITLTDYLFENYYYKLDKAVQKMGFVHKMQEELKVAIGRIAPEITWKEKDSIIKLSELKEYDKYIVVFWSSTCPHCLKAMPKLYDFFKDKKELKVIAIALETEESESGWKSETYYYPEFIHVLAMGKWENPLPRSYNVYSTPSFFVLDANKKIVAKPYEVEDLEDYIKNLKK